jgi:hypothetical protein
MRRIILRDANHPTHRKDAEHAHRKGDPVSRTRCACGIDADLDVGWRDAQQVARIVMKVKDAIDRGVDHDRRSVSFHLRAMRSMEASVV